MLRLLCVISSALIFCSNAWAQSIAEDAADIARIVQRDPRQAAADAQRLLQRGVAEGDRAKQLRALRILANAHSLLGNMFVIGEDLLQGQRLARALNDPQAWTEFKIASGNEAELAGQFGEADKNYADALSMATRTRLPLGMALSYAAMVNASLDRGTHTNVVIHATRAYDLFEGQRDQRGMASMLGALGTSSADPLRTIEYLERAAALVAGQTFRWEGMLTHYQLGVAYLTLKAYPNARFHLHQVLADAVALQTPLHLAYAELYLGQVDYSEQLFEQALVHWNHAAPVFERTKDRVAFAVTQRSKAQALCALKRQKESVSALGRSPDAGEGTSLRHGRGKQGQRISWLQTTSGEMSGFGPAQRPAALSVAGQRRIAKVSANMDASVAEARFDSKLRETENALLRMQQRGAELERVTLVLALLGCGAFLFLAMLLLLRQIRQKRRFAHLALRDELTGLRNRRSILEFARVQVSMRHALGTRLFISVLDLDHFKRVNDSFGHDAGDAALVAFAKVCQQHLRSNHALGRYGGEEFLLITPDTTEDQLFDIFERLREVVRELGIKGLPTGYRLTFSMGSAEAFDDAVTVEALVKNADAALYQAKEKGRDRYEIHRAEGQQYCLK